MAGLDELLAPLALVDGLDELLARLVLVDGVVICVEFIAAKSQWEERIEFIHACMISNSSRRTYRSTRMSYIRIYVTFVLPNVARQDGYE